MKKLLSFFLGGCVITLSSIQVFAQTHRSTLELTVHQVVVEDSIASITGPAIGAKVELFDNLGEEMLASGMTDANGQVEFTLDENYPLSGKGLYYTTIKVDGVSNGVHYCARDYTCPLTVFSVKGLDPDQKDGILIVHVVRSGNFAESVEGVQIYTWPVDENGVPLKIPGKVISYIPYNIQFYSGESCISNGDGYCVAYLRDRFNWREDDAGSLSADATLMINKQYSYDGDSIDVTEGEVKKVSIAVDKRGKLDDCILRPAPSDKLLNPSCMDKLHRTATVQAQVTLDPSQYEVINNAIVQASLLSKDTVDLFDAYETDTERIKAYLEENDKSTFDPDSQVKLILYVNEINNDGYNAYIGGSSIGKVIEITSPDDPGSLLGACEVNLLGECVSILDRSVLLAPDGLLKFHVLADGYDNGIMVCENDYLCEMHAYTVEGLTGEKDAILLFKVVSEKRYFEPIQNIIITAGMSDINSRVPTIYEMSSDESIKGCVTDRYGACPIYVNEVGAVWRKYGNSEQVEIPIFITGYINNDAVLPSAKDDQLVVYQIAVNGSGTVNDCTFSSPLTYEIPRPGCAAKKKILQTAMALYTATPTTTITPLASLTPTATEIPPISTSLPTATTMPQPLPSPAGLPGWAVALIALIGFALIGSIFYVIRSRRRN